MTKPALTSEEYVDQAGMACPACGETRFVELGRTKAYGNLVELTVWCNECKAHWLDTYVLSGYENLVQPEEKREIVENHLEDEVDVKYFGWREEE